MMDFSIQVWLLPALRAKAFHYMPDDESEQTGKVHVSTGGISIARYMPDDGFQH